MNDVVRYQGTFVAICDEWDKAEQAMKIAEQISGKAIQPSINELRYGGRRLLDSLRMVVTNADEDKIKSYLRDAEFDCLKARHDAIDAATSEMAIVLDIMQDKLGHDAILKGYPDFIQILRGLREVRSRLSVSRKDRKDREAIYASVQATDFPKLADQYQTLKVAEPIIRRLARRDRILRWVTYVGLPISLLALLISFLFWRFPYAP